MPRGKHGNHRRGTDHYRWNCGQILSVDGYVKVRVGKNHPLADPNGYAYEHLVVWESAGNRIPYRGEVIHHIDGDKKNNAIENLEIKTRSIHNLEHNAKRFGRVPLTESVVADMRRRRADGEKLKSIAADYTVSCQTVSKIARGEMHKRRAGALLDGREWKEFPNA